MKQSLLSYCCMGQYQLQNRDSRSSLYHPVIYTQFPQNVPFVKCINACMVSGGWKNSNTRLFLRVLSFIFANSYPISFILKGHSHCEWQETRLQIFYTNMWQKFPSLLSHCCINVNKFQTMKKCEAFSYVKILFFLFVLDIFVDLKYIHYIYSPVVFHPGAKGSILEVSQMSPNQALSRSASTQLWQIFCITCHKSIVSQPNLVPILLSCLEKS